MVKGVFILTTCVCFFTQICRVKRVRFVKLMWETKKVKVQIKQSLSINTSKSSSSKDSLNARICSRADLTLLCWTKMLIPCKVVSGSTVFDLYLKIQIWNMFHIHSSLQTLFYRWYFFRKIKRPNRANVAKCICKRFSDLQMLALYVWKVKRWKKKKMPSDLSKLV